MRTQYSLLVLLLAGTSCGQNGFDSNCEDLWQYSTHGQWYEDNPTYVDNQDMTAWEMSTPEEQGMDSSLIETGVDRLRSDRDLCSIILARHGVIVYEEYFNWSGVLDSNNIHSASKSILAVLVCLAIEDGFIDGVDQPIWELMPQYFQDYNAGDDRWGITVDHVLSMTTGLWWQEDDTEYTVGPNDDWVQTVLDQGVNNTPGTTFRYSTGNAHLASAVIHHATGRSTCCYANRLFRYIGIDAEHWGRDPQGIYSGGYNLYLTPRELARFGQLLLDNGCNKNGTQIIPQWIVSTCLSKQATVDGTYDYGFMFWIRELGGHTVYIAWGWGGQFIYLIPSLDILFVSTAYTDSNGSEIDADEFVSQYVIPSVEKVGVRALTAEVIVESEVRKDRNNQKQFRRRNDRSRVERSSDWRGASGSRRR